MTVTISPDDPRSVRALAVLATADRWVKGHRKDGRSFFVIPGSNGRVYWTDTRDCTCPDRRQRDETCKHIRAVRLWTIEHKAKAPAPKPAPLAADEDARLELAFAAPSPDAGAVVRIVRPSRYDALFPVEG